MSLPIVGSNNVRNVSPKCIAGSIWYQSSWFFCIGIIGRLQVKVLLSFASDPLYNKIHRLQLNWIIKSKKKKTVLIFIFRQFFCSSSGTFLSPSKLRSCVVFIFLGGLYCLLRRRNHPVFFPHNLATDEASLVFKHLKDSKQCHSLRSPDCFNILHHASTNYHLKIKEVLVCFFFF